ncbi:hypothetical protein BaRGS_00001233 [Batillaria attramentaria]|uniref:Uncharacterized protein n=1 Tax=Batillaria attramentaria TaxID=370345 RepID=A0ABD0M732_9CAEN
MTVVKAEPYRQLTTNKMVAGSVQQRMQYPDNVWNWQRKFMITSSTGLSTKLDYLGAKAFFDVPKTNGQDFAITNRPHSYNDELHVRRDKTSVLRKKARGSSVQRQQAKVLADSNTVYTSTSARRRRKLTPSSAWSSP